MGVVGPALTRRPARWHVAWWLGAVLAIAAVVVIILDVAWSVHVPGLPRSDTFSIVTSTAAAFACAGAAVRSRRRARAAWSLLGLQMLCYGAGDALWLKFGGVDSPSGVLSLADWMYLCGLVCALAGVLLLPTAIGWRTGGLVLALDVLLLAVAVLLICVHLSLGELIDTLSASAAAGYLMYPVTDLLMASLAVMMLLRSTGAARPDVMLVALAYCGWTVADSGYALLGARGVDPAGTIYEVAYTLAPVVLGLGAVVAAVRVPPPRELQRHAVGVMAVVLPDLAALTALGLVLAPQTAPVYRSIELVGALLALLVFRLVAVAVERQRLRRELETLVAQGADDFTRLSQAHERLESMKYGFVTSVSHELRTPLTSIQGALEMLDAGEAGDLPERARLLVHTATRGSNRLRLLVDDLIDAERLAAGAFTLRSDDEHLVAELVHEVSQVLQPSAVAAGVDLQVRSAVGVARCDGDRVVQALVNLVGNAIKFSPPGSEVVISSRLQERHVEVSVSDQGRGIPAEELEAVFDRFHQVSQGDEHRVAGAGLGLAITRSIVEAHGGRVWAESTLGKGATFRFTLPAATATAVLSASAVLSVSDVASPADGAALISGLRQPDPDSAARAH